MRGLPQEKGITPRQAALNGPRHDQAHFTMICLVNAFAKHRHRSGSTVIGLTCVINERSQVWRGWQFYHNSVFWPSNAFLHVIIPKFNYI